MVKECFADLARATPMMRLVQGDVGSGKTGLARRARMTVLPIMVLAPWGMWIGIPPGFLPLPAQISLRVLPAIDTTQYTGDEEAAVAAIDRDVRAHMQAALTEMSRARIPLIGTPRFLARAGPAQPPGQA